MTNQLEPCTDCGAVPILIPMPPEWGKQQRHYTCSTRNCRNSGPWAEDSETAATGWNTRQHEIVAERETESGHGG